MIETSVGKDERLLALVRVRATALEYAKSRKDLEAAVFEAWRLGLSNLSISREAGWNDANVRMLAIRRRWKRD